MYDLVLKSGNIVDGSGKTAFMGDIGIVGQIITNIGKISGGEAKKIINVEGCVVCPGFVDMHSHSDLMVMTRDFPDIKVRQGVTTELLGQDGLGVAPVNIDDKEILSSLVSSLLGDASVEWDWASLGDYLDSIDRCGLAVNVASLISHGSVRISVMGMEDRKATQEELRRMEEIIKKAMDEGAIGLSTGLIYPPCNYSDDEELIRLTKAASEKNGIFVIHMRDEGDRLIETIRHTIEICKKSGIHLHISHLKAQGKKNWHKIDEALSIMAEEKEKDFMITADRYPYIGGSTFLAGLLPPWTLEGGNKKLLERLRCPTQRQKIKNDFKCQSEWNNRPLALGWENIFVASMRTQKNKESEGMPMSKIADLRGLDPVDTVCNILIEEDGGGTMIPFYGNEEVLTKVLKYPTTVLGTDGIYGGKPHPRLYGTYPRFLGHYVRDKGIMSIEEAIYKITYLPAQIIHLEKRGLLKIGYYADITVFNPSNVADQSTFADPQKFPVGIELVLVNGKPVVENGIFTNLYPGRTLRRSFGH